MTDAESVHGRGILEDLKISCFSRGISITESARLSLSGDHTEALTIREYPTTGGVTLELPENVYVNAPFDEWYCTDPVAKLDGDDEQFVVLFGQETIPVVRVLPLPGYLHAVDSEQRYATDVAMSHTDRVRLSPLIGCAYDCGFCDLPAETYTFRPTDQVLAALDIALADDALPPRHVLISGGSPRRAHYETFEDTCQSVIEHANSPVDIMMSPMPHGAEFIERTVEAGVNGFAINLELYSKEASLRHLGRKFRTTRGVFEEFVGTAVEAAGPGRVRSLIIPGLEPLEETLNGVEFLASLGCDPVLSPFRPAENTALSNYPPMPEGDMRALLSEARRITADHEVALGPRCIPCQHNTLTFPWDVERPP